MKKQKDEQVTTINGVSLTDEMIDVLHNWQSANLPEVYLEYLSKAQDYFCLMLADYSDEAGEDVLKHMTNLIHIKKDLEQFVIPKNQKS
jgi:hypothetical protein